MRPGNDGASPKKSLSLKMPGGGYGIRVGTTIHYNGQNYTSAEWARTQATAAKARTPNRAKSQEVLGQITGGVLGTKPQTPRPNKSVADRHRALGKLGTESSRTASRHEALGHLKTVAPPKSKPKPKPTTKVSAPVRSAKPSTPKASPVRASASRSVAPKPTKAVAAKPKPKAAKAAPEPKAKTLADYIADANKALGPGTDYSALKKQLSTDTKVSDRNIAAMYAALGRDITGQAKSTAASYAAAADEQRQAADQASTTIGKAYDDSAAQVTNRLAALGIGDAAKTLAANGSNAQADEANAKSGVASRLANVLSTTAGNGAAASAMLSDTALAGQVGGVQQRASLAQQLQDQYAKLDTQKSGEDASRREKALTFALQQQSGDAQAASAAATVALETRKQNFTENFQTAKQKASVTLANRKESFNEDLQLGKLDLGYAKNTTTAAHNAATDNQAKINENGRNSRARDSAKAKAAALKLSAGKTKASAANSLASRRASARNTGLQAGLRGKELDAYVAATK